MIPPGQVRALAGFSELTGGLAPKVSVGDRTFGAGRSSGEPEECGTVAIPPDKKRAACRKPDWKPLEWRHRIGIGDWFP